MSALKNIVIAMAATFCVNANAASMEDVFDDLNSRASNPAVIKSQTMNYYHGGSLATVAPVRSYNLLSASAPTVSAGCGGIDLHMGGFSHISKQQFVAMMRNIGSNALGYGFKIALQNICPTCENVMTSLQNVADEMNKFNLNSCQAAKGLVHATANQVFDTQYDQQAMEWGSAQGIYRDATDAWEGIKGIFDPNRRKQVSDSAIQNDPALKNDDIRGNVTWDALKNLGADRRTKRQIMGLVGTVIIDNDGMKYIPPAEQLDVGFLLVKRDTVNMPMPICDDWDSCLNPNMSVRQQTPSFHKLIRDRLDMIANKISMRQSYGAEEDDVVKFVAATEIPIYKILALGTSLNNKTLATNLMDQYSTLIAVKYAESYIEMITNNTRKALEAKKTTTRNTTEEIALQNLLDNLTEIDRKLAEKASLLYTSATNTYAVAREVQFLEQTVASSLSAPILDSLEYGNSL